MKIPNFLNPFKNKGVVYNVVVSDRTEEVNDNFIKAIHTSKIQDRLSQIYDTDPNNMDPMEVKRLFSDVLRSLDYWKKSNVSF